MLAVALAPLVILVGTLAGELGSIRQRTLDETNASILDEAEQAQARQLQLDAAVLEGQLTQLSGLLSAVVPEVTQELAHGPAAAAVPPVVVHGGLLTLDAPGETTLLAAGDHDGAAVTRLAGFAATTSPVLGSLRTLVQRDPDIATAWIEDTTSYAVRGVPAFDVAAAAARHAVGVGGAMGPAGARVFHVPVGGEGDQAPRGATRPRPQAFTPVHPLLGPEEPGVSLWTTVGSDQRYRLGVDVPLSRVTTLVAQSVAGEPGAYAVLVGSDGEVLGVGGAAAKAATGDLHLAGDGTGTLPSTTPLAPVLTLAQSDRATTVTLRARVGGSDKAIVAAGLPDAHWALAAVVPTATLLPEQAALSRGIDTGIRRILVQGVPVALVLCALAFLLATVLARRLVGPVGALTAAAERLAAGDTTHPIPRQGDDEVGLLSQSLERMRREVNASRDAILAAARELEQRVADRTAELRARNEELEALNQLAGSLTRSLEPGVLLGDAVAALRTFLPLVAGRGYSVDARGLRCATAWAAADAPDVEIDLDAAATAGVEARELVLRPTPTAVVAGLPLQTADGVLGAMAVAAAPGWQPDERTRALLRAVADQVALALRTAQLSAEGRALAVLEERTRLAREIHDTLAQQLTAIVLQLEAAEALVARDRSRTREAVVAARELARSALAEARRSVWNLRPAPLETSGLPGAVALEVRRWEAQTGIAATLKTRGLTPPLALDPQAEVALFRIVQEALANCARHSRARHVRVTLEQTATTLDLTVDDDGRGFDPAAGATHPGSFGLTGMRERARLVGASLEVESAVGRGTTVRVRLPLTTTAAAGAAE